jgi:CRP-like cAMP-binding protein
MQTLRSWGPPMGNGDADVNSLEHSNQLLSRLDAETAALLKPDLVEVSLKHGVVLHQASAEIEQVYFPTHCVVSILAETKDGKTVETSIIGPEGVVGASVAIGVTSSFSAAVVQIGGTVMRMPAAKFRRVSQKSEALRNVLARFELAMLAQVQQSTACNALHNIDARACRWLLQCRDRMQSDNLPLTQEYFAKMLGVQRTSVTLTEKILQKAGIIKHQRGGLQIIDSEGLHSASCECYGRIKDRFELIFPSRPGAALKS